MALVRTASIIGQVSLGDPIIKGDLGKGFSGMVVGFDVNQRNTWFLGQSLFHGFMERTGILLDGLGTYSARFAISPRRAFTSSGSGSG